MGSIQVKKATIEHVHIVQRIGRETFSETFADSNSAADMNRYLEDSFNEHQVRTELSNPDSLFFIAWDDEDPVGYLKLNSGGAQTEKQDHSALEIERIYVKSSHHGKTVGQLLYEKAIKIAKQQRTSYIWLGVWEKNPRAIRFYEKNGFTAFDKHIFKVGDDEQMDIMMKKELP